MQSELETFENGGLLVSVGSKNGALASRDCPIKSRFLVLIERFTADKENNFRPVIALSLTTELKGTNLLGTLLSH